MEYKALNDAWLFDVSSNIWKRVKPVEVMLDTLITISSLSTILLKFWEIVP